jgi:hypothetical protein
MSSPSAVYDELRLLVKSADQQASNVARAEKAAAEKIEAASQRAVAAEAQAKAHQSECQRLLAELSSIREQAQRERRSGAADVAAARRDMEQTLKHEVSREAQRSAAELTLLREAARQDVREARGAGRAELEAAAAEWEAQAAAMRDASRLRSAKHAARLREVIASEEACDAERVRLEERLRTTSLATIGIGVRAARAERLLAARCVEVDSLLIEIDSLDAALAESEAERDEMAAASAEATEAAEAEVFELREQIRVVAGKQKQWRRTLAARHDHDVQVRVAEAVRREVSRVRAELGADAEAREAEHAAEVAQLADALAAAGARDAQHLEEVRALASLAGMSLND